MNRTSPTQEPDMIPSMPNTSPEHLVMAKKKRNVIIGSVMGGLVVVIVAIVLIYLFIFRPRVYYGNHILITTMQTPGSCTNLSTISSKSIKDPLILQKTFNCKGANIKNTQGQLVPAPNLMPSGPVSRYGIVAPSLQPYSSIGCALTIRMPCMLVTPKLERRGLVREGDAFMIWEPINNMYMFEVQQCKNLTDSTSCVGHSNVDPYDLCSWNGKTCSLVPNSVPIVFRPLPSNFSTLMADTTQNPIMKGFLFSFASKKPKDNMLRIRTNYYLTSQRSNRYVQYNVNDNRVTLQEKSPSIIIDDTFNWEILKE